MTVSCSVDGCRRTSRLQDARGWFHHPQPGRPTRYWCPDHAKEI